MPAESRDMVLVPEVEYEVWQDGLPVASADSLSDAQHYMAIYGQDGPVKAMTAFTYRVDGFTAVLPLSASPVGEGLGALQAQAPSVPTEQAGQPVVGWQPIETAPKDGTPILITRTTDFEREEGWHVVRWDDRPLRDYETWIVHDGKNDHALRGGDPEAWMPLPSATLTHPAPDDRVRVAVEALRRIATVDMGGGFLGAQACRKVASEALAALEGK